MTPVPDPGRDRLQLPGWGMRVVVPAEQSQGRLTVIDGRMEPHTHGSPDHIHAAHDELFVVRAGRLRFRVGDRTDVRSAGAVVFAPRNQPHGFHNPYGEPAHYYAVVAPSGYENYFVALAGHIARAGGVPSRAEMIDLMARHHTTLAGPPTP